MKKYSRVSYEERCQIVAFLQANFSIPKIATLLNRNKSSIYRELKRNSSKNEYRAIGANIRAKSRFKKCRRKKILNQELINSIESKLDLYWSPEQIVGRFKLERKAIVSVETIYRYLRDKPHLRQKTSFMSRRRGLSRYKQRKARKESRLTIHQRPLVINERKRFGDWERDGMYGADRKQILVCTERKSRYTKLAIMKNIDSNSVNELTLNLLQASGHNIKSITNDNGSEFRKPLKGNIPVYYCDPMSPHQRGTVENMIGVLRKQINRKTDLDLLGSEGLYKIEKKFNLTPRKGLGYKTPFEVYNKTKVALAM